MRTWRNVVAGWLLFAGTEGCAEDGIELPEVVAHSKYVDYGAWADVSDTCMTARLRRWDEYIERVAGNLGVDVPARRIVYTWVPEAEVSAETWPCAGNAGGCANYDAKTELAIVFTQSVEKLHELVHAVEGPLGPAHPVFEEGMAEYLSEMDPTDAALRDFAAEFKAMLDRPPGEVSGYYRRSMHFVGSLIQRDGMTKYKDYRGRVPEDGGVAEFAGAYAEVYGGDFEAALAEMARAPIQGRWIASECEGDAMSPAWSSPAVLEATLAGECGDGGLFGGGLAAGEPAYSKYFTLDILTSGYYALTVEGADGEASDAVVTMRNCPGVRWFDQALTAETGTIMVWQGRHQVRVDYASKAAARSGVKLRLENLNPEGL